MGMIKKTFIFGFCLFTVNLSYSDVTTTKAGNISVTVMSGSNGMGLYNQGVAVASITNINCGTGITCTNSLETGILTVTGGVGGDGSSSLAVGTGSAVAMSIISSPTAVISFDSATFKVQLVGGATAFIFIHYCNFKI